MADSSKRPEAEESSPSPLDGQPGPIPGSPPGNGTTGSPGSPGRDEDPAIALRRGLEATRLPASAREQVLGELPPPDEQERLYRDLQARGGLSFEELLDSSTPDGAPRW
jgi:hypothetical protein